MRLLIALVALTPLLAQETQAERQAARDVLRKIDALEKSLNVPDMVTRLTAPDAGRDEAVARAKQLMDTEMLALGDEITRHPEIGFQEQRSVATLTRPSRNTALKPKSASQAYEPRSSENTNAKPRSPTIQVLIWASFSNTMRCVERSAPRERRALWNWWNGCAEYQQALEKTYTLPNVAEPK